MSPGIIGSPLTALTARIVFDGKEIGTLQEITIEEDFKVRQIDQIGSNIPAVFLPGTQTGRIVAARAMLDADLFFDTLTPSLVPNSNMADAIEDVIEDGSMTLKPPFRAAEQIYNWMESLFSGRVQKDRATFVVSFDIELLNPTGVIFAKFKDCVLTARSFSVTINNIVVMQNITMMFRNREI